MKNIYLIVFLFAFVSSFAQQQSFILQGQVVDSKDIPVADAYFFNQRNSDKTVSRSNGVFDVRILPGDTIIITHISYMRKNVTAYELMVNPIVKLELDTVNIKQINISANQRSDYEKALENIRGIEFKTNPLPSDNYSESEKIRELMSTENRVLRVQASSISLLRFSPSEQLGKLIEKRKKRKEADQFYSTKDTEQATK